MSAALDLQHDSKSQIRLNADESRAVLLLVFDEVRTSAPDHHGIFSGFQWESLRGKLLRAGIPPEKCYFALLKDMPIGEGEWKFKDSPVTIGFGESVLNYFTGKKQIDKWHLSPLDSKFGGKFIPTFDLNRINAQYELNLYQEIALRRAKQLLTISSPTHPERFLLNPSFEQSLAVLREIKTQPRLSVDVETGYGQINTVGFAWSESDAIAINVDPARLSDTNYHILWDHISTLLGGPAEKIFHNFIYDVSYFSAYGVGVNNIYHDTMWGMKFLYPELDMNLGNAGRIYTNRIYWKDDGKVESEEGKKKNWGEIRDWTRHYLYNCRDTTGTFEVAVAQIQDIQARGLTTVFDSYIRHLIEPVLEMCANGIPIDLDIRERLKTEAEKRSLELIEKFKKEAGPDISPTSPKQIKTYLQSKGVKLPKKYDKKTGTSKETTDASSIMKIRLKHPEIACLTTLSQVTELNTALSRYINFGVKPGESLFRYTLNGFGTETGRMAGHKDPWDRGFNPHTIPREGTLDFSIKSMFVAPEGHSFIEVDLKQAESRFVAYDAACRKLIDMLESNEDVHAYVAYAILRELGLPSSDYTKKWRQLGKKTGHGANYMMKEGVFIESVFSEMEMILTKPEATAILNSYRIVEFPEITEWQNSIGRELYQRRKLKAPSGWERYFYGRPGSDMTREGVAWRPQHTIPWITNHLMFKLCDRRKSGDFTFNLLLQAHDAVYMLAKDTEVERIANAANKVRDWHPEVILPGGKLIIPPEIKYGKTLATMKEWEGK